MPEEMQGLTSVNMNKMCGSPKSLGDSANMLLAFWPHEHEIVDS